MNNCSIKDYTEVSKLINKLTDNGNTNLYKLVSYSIPDYIRDYIRNEYCKEKNTKGTNYVTRNDYQLCCSCCQHFSFRIIHTEPIEYFYYECINCGQILTFINPLKIKKG